MTYCWRRLRAACLRWKCAGCRVGARSPVTECPCRRRGAPTRSQSYDPLTPPPADAALFQETVIVTHDQLRLDHLNSIHCHADDNQQRRPAEVEVDAESLCEPLWQCRVQPGSDVRYVLNMEPGVKKFRDDRDQSQIESADQSDSGQN